MATPEEYAEGYRRRIDEMNDRNRRNAAVSGAPVLVMNPQTGQLRMEGLRPGQRASYEHNGVIHLHHG